MLFLNTHQDLCSLFVTRTKVVLFSNEFTHGNMFITSDCKHNLPILNVNPTRILSSVV